MNFDWYLLTHCEVFGWQIGKQTENSMQRTEFCSERTEIMVKRTDLGVKTYKPHVKSQAIFFMNAVPIYQQTAELSIKYPQKKHLPSHGKCSFLTVPAVQSRQT